MKRLLLYRYREGKKNFHHPPSGASANETIISLSAIEGKISTTRLRELQQMKRLFLYPQ